MYCIDQNYIKSTITRDYGPVNKESNQILRKTRTFTNNCATSVFMARGNK